MLRKFLNYIDLRNEVEDFDKIHDEIVRGTTFKGTNLWILVFAIIVASVGLNTNSPAVVIGAMLISPLMGPINGMGYSLATYNFDLFRRSFRNFGFSVLASLATSTLYFLISPVSTAYSELLARTSPTIYDVLIALFGGLAGIVAISSKLKGNVIPGVAIATALMPPLCTAGFGLATGHYNYFFGAFYLFTINSVFIAISSVIASRIFGFPITNLVAEDRKKQINRWITVVITITILPSIYLGYVLVKNERFNESANRYVNNVTIVGGSYLLKNEVNAGDKSIRLVYGGNVLTEPDKVRIKNNMKDFSLEDATVEIEQGFSSNTQDYNEAELLKNKLNATLLSLENKNHEVDSIKGLPIRGRQILHEIQPLFPQVVSCSFSETYIYTDSLSQGKPQTIVIFGVQPESLNLQSKQRVLEWLKARIENKNVEALFIDAKSVNKDSSSTIANKK
jgi:uncharacterized hydrophobic protein (TIGR00271 family)